jgi:hypothetical protein
VARTRGGRRGQWRSGRTSENLPQGGEQRHALGIGADGDAQVLLDARQLEMADDDGPLAQRRGQRAGIVLRVAGEDSLGHIRFLLFYVLCGVAAALMQYFIDPSSTLPMIGASGAIAGVLGAYWSLYPHSSIRSLVPIGFFITLLNIPASIMIGLWFVTQLLNGYASIAPTSATGEVGGVAFWAHIGGFVAGLLLIRIFPKKKRDFWRVD